jgi:hypothetical protein
MGQFMVSLSGLKSGLPGERLPDAKVKKASDYQRSIEISPFMEHERLSDLFEV